MNSSLLLVNIFIQIVLCFSDSGNDIKAVDLKCEYLHNPLAIDIPEPRLSWSLEATDFSKHNLSQKSYQILVATNKEELSSNSADLWDSGKVVRDRSVHIKYEGIKLKSRQRAHWKVRVWDQEDRPSDYSPIAFWDKGLDINDWSAEWIGAPKGTQQKALQNISDIDSKFISTTRPGLVPVLYLRKTFTSESFVKSAKLYATAQGVYKIIFNGKQVSDNEFSPGFTDYNKTIQYQSHEVKDFMTNTNTIGVILGTGWFSSYVGYLKQFNNYGSDQNFLLELHIEYENNKTDVIMTDNSWKVTTGPLIYSDLLMGELYYEERRLNEWESVDYDDEDWVSVVTKPIDKKVALLADRAQPLRVVQTLRPKSKYESSPGVWVLDFEQNMVGRVQIKYYSSKGARIQLRHAEALNPNGTIYTLNLRSALATDVYVLKNKPLNNRTLVLEPHFTIHGFRYIEVTGFPGEPTLDHFIGQVISADTPYSAEFVTSNQMINKLMENIVWTQRGNFQSVPTGCSQRDERIGWLGDAGMFASSSCYNADVAPFYTKWMRDVRDAQSAEGGFSDIAPRIVDLTDGGPAWGDAGVIIPFHVWRMFGDLEIIKENYDSMKAWIEYILSQNPDFIWTKRVNNNFGDWLSINADTPKEVLSTAYFGYDALLMAKMAKAINETKDEQKYLELHSNISNAFVKSFVNTTDGRINGDTQTVYVLALSFDLLPQNIRSLASSHLADNIKANDWHLSTGFVGLGYLCSTLTQFGHNDIAYRIILQESYPSWGYMIKYNATTIWEHWNSWTKEKGFSNPNMNSFNHFAFGSIGRWLYQSVAGIDTDNENVGFKHILIKPNPGDGLSFVRSSYQSINGLILNSWQIKDNKFSLNTTIPVNTRATIDLTFTENGNVQEVGSGSYYFEVQLN